MSFRIISLYSVLISCLGVGSLVAADRHGVHLEVFDIRRPMTELYELVPGQTPNVSRYAPQVDFPGAGGTFGVADQFIAQVTGAIVVEHAGNYSFRLISDDGAKLWIDQGVGLELLIDTGGEGGARAVTASLDLTAGKHPFRINMFDNGWFEGLHLHWQPPGTNYFTIVPESALVIDDGIVHVTSPGSKRIRFAGSGGPGDRQPVGGVHPGYDLVDVRPPGFEVRVGCMAFLRPGELLVGSWNGVFSTDNRLYLLRGVDGLNANDVSVSTFASDLHEPHALVVDGDTVYAAERGRLSAFRDADGDGVAEERWVVADDIPYGGTFHEFNLGLIKQGDRLWMGLAAAIHVGGSTVEPQPAADRGALLSVDPLTGSWEVIASGLRTPNGFGDGPDGTVFGADNQGDWLPSCRINHLRPGVDYGHRTQPAGRFAALPPVPPALWLPHGEIGLSTSQPQLVPEGQRFAGQLMFGDVTHGGVKRASMEQIDGVWQGAAFRFSQGLEAGINRIRWHGGELYTGGIGTEGNWGQWGKKYYSLQKLVPNDRQVFEAESARLRSDGLILEFSDALDAHAAAQATSYEVRGWRYVPTSGYGGPKVDERELAVTAVQVSQDHRSVFLQIPGLLAGHMLYVRTRDLTSAVGDPPWSTELWYTINVVPTARSGADFPVDFSAGLKRPDPVVAPVAGLRYHATNLFWPFSVSAIDAATPAKTGVIARPDLSVRTRNDSCGLEFMGLLVAPVDGVYGLAVTSDDGSVLEIGSQIVIDNDGLHGSLRREGSIGLQAGPHLFDLKYFNLWFGRDLRVQWRLPGSSQWQDVPADAFIHSAVAASDT